MAGFNINKYNQNNYQEMSFVDGLEYAKCNPNSKLFSDGLEFDEYIIYKEDHFEYEDGCFLGRDPYEIISRIGGGTTCWVFKHKFYIKIN